MKLKVTLSIGLVGGRKDVIEIDDEDLKGLTAEEREKAFSEAWQEWAWQYGARRLMCAS